MPSGSPNNSDISMKKPTAVIDKSLLQEVCKQDPKRRNICENILSDRYQIVVAAILVEEVWVNLANRSGKATPEVLEQMKEFMIRCDGSWIDDPLEIAFSELVEGKSIETLPSPKNLIKSFSVLRRDDPAFVGWVTERAKVNKTNVSQRVKMHAGILPPDKFVPVKSGRYFFEQLIRPKFVEMISDPERKRLLLERELGLSFRANHPEKAAEIDKAFDAYSPETFEKYQATLVCIIAAMVYFYAPLCKFGRRGDNNAIKIIGRGNRDQSNNISDEKYVQSALLCERLLTRDQGMHNVMELLTDCGFWKGTSVFINPKKDTMDQISHALV